MSGVVRTCSERGQVAEPVLKAAESRRIIFPPSPILNPDGSQVTWTIYTDVATGADGMSPVPAGGGGGIGRGHLSPPAVPPGPGTVVVIAPPDPEPPVFVYIAACDTVQHAKETPGNVDPNGFWNSGFFENCADAFAAAGAHADGAARVDAVTGGVGVSIIGCN
jgi:hypothetical protein